MTKSFLVIYLCTLLIVIISAQIQTTESTVNCASRNSTCQQCVEDTNCYWCKSSKSCHFRSEIRACSWGDARWSHCWLNVEALVISCAVIGGIILLLITCICCWCCRKYNACSRRRLERQVDQQELEAHNRAEQRRSESEQRRIERRAKGDELRQKYGLGGGPRHERLNEEDED